MRPLVFAHRGSAQVERENTLAAFIAARDLGADGVEFDVRRTSDGALVIHHDPHIDAVGAIADTAMRDLPSYVPLLRDALDACEPMQINVEIKNDASRGDADVTSSLATAVVEEILELDLAQRVIVSSFDIESIRAVRLAEPSLAVGWLLDLALDQRRALDRARAEGFSAIHPYFLHVDDALVSAAHEGGLAINTWTVDAHGDLVSMTDLGVDTIITDDVALALEVVDP